MIGSLAFMAAAISTYADIPVITGMRTVGQTCVVSARDLSGAFEAVVTWASCSEVKIRLNTIAELAETNEFNGLECEDVAAIVHSNGGHLVTAWGKFTATVYARAASGSTREIAIAD